MIKCTLKNKLDPKDKRNFTLYPDDLKGVVPDKAGILGAAKKKARKEHADIWNRIRNNYELDCK